MFPPELWRRNLVLSVKTKKKDENEVGSDTMMGRVDDGGGEIRVFTKSKQKIRVFRKSQGKKTKIQKIKAKIMSEDSPLACWPGPLGPLEGSTSSV